MASEVSFGADQLLLLNGILALMIFGVSLTLKIDDFTRILRAPKAPMTGLIAQFMLLPAFTCVATWAVDMEPSMALGMMLVAACPGGTFSNIMTFIARGNLAVSVSMTAVSSVAAVLLTPFNFAFYASLNPNTKPLLQAIALDPLQMVTLFVFVLVLPLIAGMLCGKFFPTLVKKSEQPFRLFSIIALLAFVAVACAKNLQALVSHMGLLTVLVIAHNTFALGLGFIAAKMCRLAEPDTRAVTLEVGIQNSGLALVILFTFFPDQSNMLVVAAFWGIWHLVSGGLLATYWSRSAKQETAFVY
ncbi:bile acid:sodium symporter family protein [Simiduia litorea]|uniref:bile acid:sodium symporter family protein n=1 Tax=Simiduia litorea TaxID=1435348 RepID=UPI0036F36F01